MPMKISRGDVVQMKKQHPCGNDKWEITRVGMDIRVKCLKCNRQVLMPREKFEKRVKKIISSSKAE